VDVLADVLRKVAEGREQRFPVAELGRDALEQTLALDVDLLRSVDHDLADRGVFEVLPHRGEELQQRLFENRLGDHGTLFRSEARAVSLNLPLGSSRMYSRNSWSTSRAGPPSSRSTVARAKWGSARSGFSATTCSSLSRASASSPHAL